MFPILGEIIISFSEQGDDFSNPCNYRQIVLALVVCAKQLNALSIKCLAGLGKRMIMTKHQSGFRKKRSITDHLVKLESTIRDAFLNKRHLVSIFFV